MENQDAAIASHPPTHPPSLPSPHHEGLVHVELSAGAAVVVLGVHGEAEEEHVHHDLKDRQEAVGHQPGEQADDEQGQDPHRVVPLEVELQHASERRARDDQYLDLQHTDTLMDERKDGEKGGWEREKRGKRKKDRHREKRDND